MIVIIIIYLSISSSILIYKPQGSQILRRHQKAEKGRSRRHEVVLGVRRVFGKQSYVHATFLLLIILFVWIGALPEFAVVEAKSALGNVTL
jgi:hypothetical protein